MSERAEALALSAQSAGQPQRSLNSLKGERERRQDQLRARLMHIYMSEADHQWGSIGAFDGEIMVSGLQSHNQGCGAVSYRPVS